MAGTAMVMKPAMPRKTSRGGFRPMFWDCEMSGCFNRLRRPKIEMFSECFPGRINFGDVDGLVEISGYFCMLEWKGEGGSIKTGQRISYEAFTAQKYGNVVFVIEGDAETMEVGRYCRFWLGQQTEWIDADLENVKKSITRWSQLARAGEFELRAA